MSPLPGWPVIPDGWAESHRPTVEGTMTEYVELCRPRGPAPFPRPPEWVEHDVLWSGYCRLQELKRESSAVPAYQPTEMRQYLLVLPFRNKDGVPLPQLKVGEGGDQAHVVGRTFQLKQGMTGSLLFEHDFIIWENQTQENP